MKISVRVPGRIVAWLDARGGRSKAGREALEEYYAMKTNPRLRDPHDAASTAPRPPSARDIALEFYPRWERMVTPSFDQDLKRKVWATEFQQLDTIYAFMIKRGWIKGPREMRDARQATTDRVREVLDALRAIHTAKGLGP